MTGTTAEAPGRLPARLTGALTSLWTEYAGTRPTDVRTDVRGNVVTCRLVDAVGDFDRSMTAPQACGA